MMQRIHEKIRHLLETTPGLTQRGLAEHMGLNPAQVNRMIHGQRNIRVEEVPVIEAYLGATLDLRGGPAPQGFAPQQHGGSRPRGFAEAPGVMPPAPPARHTGPVPVYGYAAGAEDLGLDGAGLNLGNDGGVVDWVTRHPAQIGIRDAFAIYVFSDSMEPRYYRGELVYVHPGRPAEPGRDCVIEMKNGDAYIKRLLRVMPDKIRVAQYNPAQERDLPREEIKALYAVIGRG
ncbi:MAG: helix-turn-helix domain-containing protein [Alphaproteobacteria bacterium]|nr:helix-turn-helix domain-containing protein [Alphaproteobacteria bacterium]